MSADRPDLPVSLFDFDLPEELIALRPARPRSSARLLLARGARFEDRVVSDLPQILRAGDILVFNDAKVIPARLDGARAREGGQEIAVEVTLIARLDGATWRALARPGRRLRPGDRIRFADLEAEMVRKDADGAAILRFALTGEDLDAAIARIGAMPLPPYIAGRRRADARDAEDYQTAFAARPGAVAAPTAALHFDAALLAALDAAGVARATVTLHVGAGTFLPVKAETTAGHVMHSESGEIDAPTAARIAAARAAGGRVIAVGTTALRVLETAAASGALAAWCGETDIFITPGYRFRAIDGLMTNFHLPKSTLMMLVSAWLGLAETKALYRHAIERRYRFYSYGDSSLLFPPYSEHNS